MKKHKIVLALTGLLIACGCTSKLYMPAAANVEKARVVSPDITLTRMKEARHLYVVKCSNCHNLHLPEEFTDAQWKKNLDKMQPKAKITNQEKQLLYTYLTSE